MLFNFLHFIGFEEFSKNSGLLESFLQIEINKKIIIILRPYTYQIRARE